MTTGDHADIRGLAPPSLSPSGACLGRGARLLNLFTPSRVTPYRGGISATALSPFTWQLCGTLDAGTIPPPSLGGHGDLLGKGPQKRAQLPGHRDHDLLRVFPPCAALPSALTQADLGLHRTSGIGVGRFARRRGRGRRTWAGEREAQAPSTSARRAGVCPVCVMPPWRRRAPLAYPQASGPDHACGVWGSRRESGRRVQRREGPPPDTARHGGRGTRPLPGSAAKRGPARGVPVPGAGVGQCVR